MSLPFYFGIPFLSATVARDFDVNCKMLRHTLRTCLNQSDNKNVRVVVCHNEMPNDLRSEFPEVNFIRSPMGPPNPSAQKEGWRLDKRLKLKSIALLLADEGGGHFMMTDADDLISKDLVAQVRAAGESVSVMFASGYMVNLHNRTFVESPLGTGTPFYSACGTSMALYLTTDDIPTHINDFSSKRFYNRLGGHKVWVENLRQEKRNYIESEQPSVVYIRSHGANITAHRADGTFSGALHKGKLHEASKPLSQFNDANFDLTPLL